MALGVDIGLVGARQELDHVQVVVLGGPVQTRVARGEVLVSGQLGVLHEHLSGGLTNQETELLLIDQSEDSIDRY